MTPITPGQTSNNTNNSNSIEEDLAWSQTYKIKSVHCFSHVTINVLGLKSDDVSDLDNWMKYQLYSSLQDIISEYFSSPHDHRLRTNCKRENWGCQHAATTCCHVAPGFFWLNVWFFISKMVVSLIPISLNSL